MNKDSMQKQIRILKNKRVSKRAIVLNRDLQGVVTFSSKGAKSAVPNPLSRSEIRRKKAIKAIEQRKMLSRRNKAVVGRTVVRGCSKCRRKKG